VDTLLADVEALLGSSSGPGRYLLEIRDLKEPESWAFKADAEDPLERTRRAVRALATCDYASWAESALVVEILSSMADEHPSSLVRAEALDTLARLAVWTFRAESPTDHPSTNAEMIEAVKVLKSALGKDDSDAAMTFQVTAAVATLATYPFDRVELGADAGSHAVAAREHSSQLRRLARGALRAINGRGLEGFLADPGVREALDEAFVSVSADVIRLTLAKAALADPAETTRAAALRDIGNLAYEDSAAVAGLALRHDPYASVRREAARALRGYPVETAAPHLLDALTDEMADVRGAAAASLAILTGQDFGDDRAGWVRWWQSRARGAAPEGGSPPPPR
jgi:hypothetical protein